MRIFDWEGIHTQPITGVVYQPERNQAFTSSLEPSTAVRALLLPLFPLPQRACGSPGRA